MHVMYPRKGVVETDSRFAGASFGVGRLGWSEGEARAIGSRDQIGWSGGPDRDGQRSDGCVICCLSGESDGVIIGLLPAFRYATGPPLRFGVENHRQAVRRAARRLQLLWWKVIDDGAR